MAKIILRAILWGAVSWLVLSLILFFGAGFYSGFIAQDPGAEVSPLALIVLRYAVLLLALGIAAVVFIKEEKKLPEPFKPIPPKPVFIPPAQPIPPIKPILPKPPTITPIPPPKPAPAPFVPPKPVESKTFVPLTSPTPPIKPTPPIPPKPIESAGMFVPPKPFVPPKISGPTIQPTRPFGPPPVQTSTPPPLPKSEDLKKTPDQTPWS